MSKIMKTSNSSSTLRAETTENSDIEDNTISQINFTKSADDKNLKAFKKFEEKRKLRDELVFCLNILLTLTSVAIIFGFPTWFARINSIAYAILFAHRLYEFHIYKWDFYLIDFCYLVNTTVIVYSEFFQKTENWQFWFLTAFAFSLGPILFANFVFNFGFVFHNTIKFTSFFTHLAPGIVMFIARWHNETNKNLMDNLIYSYINSNSQLKNFANIFELGNLSFFSFGLFVEYIRCCAILYFSWAVIYYLIIFKLCFNFTEKNGFLTQYSAMAENTKNNKHLKFFGDGFEGLSFMFLHLRYVSGCILISFLYLFSYQLGLITLIICTLVAIWNASTYYMQFFSKNYMLQFDAEIDFERQTPV
jgi:hypothetical protein